MEEQKNIENNTPVEYNTNLNNLNETPKPKKSPVGGIIIALLVLVILGLVCYIAYDKGYLDKILNKNETKEENKKEDNTEQDITDAKVKYELDYKIEVLKNYDADIVSPATPLFKNITAKEIPDGEKLNTVLLYLYNNKKGIIDDYTNYPNFTYEGFKKEHNLTEEDFDDMALFQPYYDDDEEGNKLMYFKSSDVKKIFKEVYGYEPTTTIVEDELPEFYYEKDYDSYFVVISGGGTCGTYNTTYNYKYTEDKDYAYVYTTVAYYSCDPGVYSDIGIEKEVATIDMEKDEKVDEEFVKNNMSKFNKYRIVFKKDGSNYTFEKVEEVK